MRRLFLCSFVMLLSTSCGLFSRSDVYVDATVGQAIDGSVSSETGTYRLIDPRMIAVEKDYALFRDGKKLAILSCDGFEDTLAALDGVDYRLLVQNWANPFPHFRIRGFEVGESIRPASFVLADSELPTLLDRSIGGLEYYETTDMDAWQASPPAGSLVDRQILIRGHVERVVGAIKAGGDAAGTPAGAAGKEGALPAPGETVHYFITSGDVKVEVAPIAENGVLLLLEGMASEGTPVRFGGFLTQVSGAGVRRATGVYGTFQLGIFDFAGKICMLK